MNRLVLISLATCLLLSLSACATKKPEKKTPDSESQVKIPAAFEQLSLKSEARTVFEDAGKFILLEGSKCMQRDNGREPVTIVQWIEMPGYVDSGTVVLNGWDLRYANQDREVNSMRADITHSKLVKNTGSTFLAFEAQGKLDDQNRSDAFEFCVFYTAFGYQSAEIGATIEEDYNGVETSALQDENQGAVTVMEHTGQKGTLKRNEAIAIIPRGFDFQFADTFECEWRWIPCKWRDRTDYPLLQAAYNLSQTNAAPNPDGSPHWAAQTIFKDNNTHAHRVKTRAAWIRGRSVKLRADFLALNPRAGKANTCRKSADGVVRTQTVRIHELPYDYAIPMLTGWDLTNECEQQRVQRAGIWIHDIHFDPQSQRLEYKVSSILRDRDGAPSFNSAHRVTVLGLNLLSSAAQQRAPRFRLKLRE